jgi:hypothetical protein
MERRRHIDRAAGRRFTTAPTEDLVGKSSSSVAEILLRIERPETALLP